MTRAQAVSFARKEGAEAWDVLEAALEQRLRETVCLLIEDSWTHHSIEGPVRFAVSTHGMDSDEEYAIVLDFDGESIWDLGLSNEAGAALEKLEEVFKELATPSNRAFLQKVNFTPLYRSTWPQQAEAWAGSRWAAACRAQSLNDELPSALAATRAPRV